MSSSEADVERGLDVFLGQLVEGLSPDDRGAGTEAVLALAEGERTMHASAVLQGRFLLENGFSVAQVVYGYGDVCQVITEMAEESDLALDAVDFRQFNSCLDRAIAGAVSAYGEQREKDLAYQGTERLGVLAHELRNFLNTALLSFDLIQRGVVEPRGSTGAILGRSLAGLRSLVERSLAEVRLDAGDPKLERTSLSELIEEMESNAKMQAAPLGLRLVVLSGEDGVDVDVDRQLLGSAVSNLLQNALKFTRPHGSVVLATRTTADRVAIDVRDQCGGLPAGRAERWFQPFSRGDSDRSGLGLGLAIARRAVHANFGEISVQNLPGEGCIFTIDLPRSRARSTSDIRVEGGVELRP